MKKALIAGAASVALAALPVVGVFADSTDVTSHTDKISITLEPVCTLGTVQNGEAQAATDETTHADYSTTSPRVTTGTWTDGTGTAAASGENGRTDTLAATLVNSQTYSNLGTTTFTIRCTNAAGYELKAVSDTADNGKATLVSTTLNTNKIYSGDGSGSGTGEHAGEWLPGTDDSYWNFKLSGATGNITIASGFNAEHVIPITTATIVASSTSAGNLNGGESVTVTYGAGINNTQPSGTYEGKVIYTLVQKSGS